VPAEHHFAVGVNQEVIGGGADPWPGRLFPVRGRENLSDDLLALNRLLPPLSTLQKLALIEFLQAFEIHSAVKVIGRLEGDLAHQPLGGLSSQGKSPFFCPCWDFTCFEIFLLHIFGLTGQVHFLSQSKTSKENGLLEFSRPLNAKNNPRLSAWVVEVSSCWRKGV
jgi:hypothetical protein